MQFRHIDVALMLAACAAMPISHAADTPKTAAQAGQTAGQYIDDATLTTKVKVALLSDTIMSLFEIKVDSDKGVVTLSGAVDKPETIDRAVKLASAVPGVKGVNPLMTVKSAS